MTSLKNSRLSILLTAAEKSLYWRFRRGFEMPPEVEEALREDEEEELEVLAIVAALEVRCRMKSSVAMVMVKEAEALQAAISGSRERMRFMRDTREYLVGLPS